MYYNTLNHSSTQLHIRKRKAETQDAIIAAIFECNGLLSPSQCKQAAYAMGHYWPLTSVRRSINTLTRKGILEKTEDKILGEYGAHEHVWQLVA